MKEALIDNTALSYFADLNAAMARAGYRWFDIFDLMTSLVERLHVPMQMQAEFARPAAIATREAILARIQSSRSPFVPCPHKDLFTSTFLNDNHIKGLDPGESEAIAQSDAIKVRFFITDDIRCVKAINHFRPVIHCVNSLFILAALDLHGYLAQRDIVFGKYMRDYQSQKEISKASLLRKAYQDVASHYRLAIDKRMLNLKSSIKRLPA